MHDPIPFGLCLYGMTYSLGIAHPPELASNPMPLSAEDFADLAAAEGAAFVEVDARILGNGEDRPRLEAFRDHCAGRGLGIVLDGPLAGDPDNLRRGLRIASLLGADRMRVTLSKILCADRKPVGGLAGWRDYLNMQARFFREIMPEAEDLGIRVAMENHQDATSWDLIELCEKIDSPNIGITFDVGNALATAEEPVAYARRILPYLVHSHCKDYWMFNAPEGYRLVRAPFGEGVVDFESVLRVFQEKDGITWSIELAALQNRYIRVLAEDYWGGLGERDVKDVIPVLRLWREHGRDGDYETPWEKRDLASLAVYEMDQVKLSMANARELWQRMNGRPAG